MRDLHQTPEEIIKAANPEQRILWNYLLLLCGERLSISQLYYQGAIAGSEFVTFRARRLYFAYNFEAGRDSPYADSNGAMVSFYDQNNALSFNIMGAYPSWNAALALMWYSTYNTANKNLYFSRILNNGVFLYMKFNGYRIVY